MLREYIRKRQGYLNEDSDPEKRIVRMKDYRIEKCKV